MLLLGIMGYFIYSQEDGNEIIEIANIGPGSPKAELILPQGQVIELDSSFQEIVLPNINRSGKRKKYINL